MQMEREPRLLGWRLHVYLEPDRLLPLEGKAPAICKPIDHQEAEVVRGGLLEGFTVEGELGGCVRDS